MMTSKLPCHHNGKQICLWPYISISSLTISHFLRVRITHAHALSHIHILCLLSGVWPPQKLSISQSCLELTCTHSPFLIPHLTAPCGLQMLLFTTHPTAPNLLSCGKPLGKLFRTPNMEGGGRTSSKWPWVPGVGYKNRKRGLPLDQIQVAFLCSKN